MERRTTQVRITQWYYSTINNPTWEQAVSFFFRTRMTRIRQNFCLLTLDALWLLMHTIPKYTYRDWHISFSLLTCYMFLKYHWEALSSSVHLKYKKKKSILCAWNFFWFIVDYRIAILPFILETILVFTELQRISMANGKLKLWKNYAISNVSKPMQCQWNNWF